MLGDRGKEQFKGSLRTYLNLRVLCRRFAGKLLVLLST